MSDSLAVKTWPEFKGKSICSKMFIHQREVQNQITDPGSENNMLNIPSCPISHGGVQVGMQKGRKQKEVHIKMLRARQGREETEHNLAELKMLGRVAVNSGELYFSLYGRGGGRRRKKKGAGIKTAFLMHTFCNIL